MNSSLARSVGRVIDTDEVSGSLSSRSLICSIFTRMPPLIHGCAIRCSYSVDRLIESISLPSSSSRPPVPVRKMILYGCSVSHQFVRGKVGIDVEDLPAGGFAEAGDDRDRTAP